MCASGGTPRDTERADLHVRESLSRSPCEFHEEMGHDWATGDDPQLIEPDWVSRRLLTLETGMEHGINEAFPEAVSA